MDSRKYRPIQDGPSSMADPEAIFEIDYPHDLPTYVLARFAGINVDAYTNFVATILLRDFQLPVKGQRHISTALSNLPMFMATDQRLQFGWGQESMMRSRYIHSQGYEHACIIIALSSTFHQSYAVEVLHHMTVNMAGPRDMIPHIKQWREMVRAGSGSFTPCDFDLIVEDFIRLDPYSLGPGLYTSSRKAVLPPPKSMAATLVELSSVTSKRQKQLILSGGPVIAWFAAIGEYFYDLCVVIKSSDGRILHGQDISDKTQLVLIYDPVSDLKILTEASMAMGIDAMSQVTNCDTESSVPLKFGGRVEWQALLSKVFGRAFHQSIEHEHARDFYTAVGTAARILEHETLSALKHGDTGPGPDVSAPSSFGINLIQNIAAWLPELRSGQGRMERQLKNNLEDSLEQYFKQYDLLAHACKCQVCSDNADQRPHGGYCLPLIMEAIIALGRTISHLIVVSKLYPSREGLQRLYLSQISKRHHAQQRQLKGLELFRYLYLDERHGSSSSMNGSNARRLQDAIQLFSGTKVHKHVPESSAGLVHEGICAYLDRLQKSDRITAPADREAMIKVSSGAIFGRAKIYNRVSLQTVKGEEEDEEWSWEEVQFDHWSTPLYFR